MGFNEFFAKALSVFFEHEKSDFWKNRISEHYIVSLTR